MKKISVIIPSFNSRRTIAATLQSIEEQTQRERIVEVLVIDSSTDPETRPFLKKFRGIELIEAGRRLMPAQARNMGAKLAQGEILVFIDSDAVMARDWMENILTHVESGRKVGGGSILLPEFQKNKWVASAQYFLQFNEYMDSGPTRVKPFLPSCNMFCERELFFEVGGFPPLRASEDVLFFLKASKFQPVWFIPQAQVFHIFRPNFSAMARNQRLLGKYVLIYRRLAEKTQFYYRGLWPLLFLPAFMAIKFWRIARRLFASRWETQLQFWRTSPAFFLGFLFWGVGFAEGVWAADESAAGIKL